MNKEERKVPLARRISCQQEEYPRRLLSIPVPPKQLYVLGGLPAERMPSVAVIGARDCSGYGHEMAVYFGRGLAQAGALVVSGMARGVDGIAQRSALEAGGKSLAVLGSGLDICYPRQNKPLYEQLAAKGCLVSEFPPGTPPKARHFPARNRIISGLADLVLVIEAREKSGTLITVDMALEQGREVAVLPGRMTDPLSLGCNRLIQQGAALVTSVEEVLELLQGKYSGLKLPPQNKNFQIQLAKDENIVYSYLDFYVRNLDEIVSDLRMPLQEVLHILFRLEQKGYIVETAKNSYRKKIST